MNTEIKTATCEEPEARFDQFGASAMSDSELFGHETGRQLINSAGSMAALARWSQAEFSAIHGISTLKARQLAVILEIGRRMLSPATALPVLNRPELIAEYMRPAVTGLEVEKFWVLSLNRKNRLIKCTAITSGTATSSLAHPREVFREAIRNGATAIVCVHNHPSGDPAPSAADVQVTRQLREAARALDVDLIDHIVCGNAAADPRGTGYYSFREAGIV